MRVCLLKVKPYTRRPKSHIAAAIAVPRIP